MSLIASVTELLMRHAAKRGQQAAFSGPDGRTITYGALATRTARIAGHLAQLGVARGQRVAIILESCVEAAESTYAITRAAAVGAPLDPRSTQAELSQAFKASGARVVITDRQQLQKVRDAFLEMMLDGETVFVVVVGMAPDAELKLGPTQAGMGHQNIECVVVRYEEWVERDARQPARDDLGLDDAAWLHFTSGTTGERKGVLSSQRAWITSATNSYMVAYGLTPGDQLFWPLPLFYALGHSFCLIGTLIAGASAFLLGQAPLLESLRRQQNVSIIAGVPTIYREIVRMAEHTTGLRLPRLRACVTGGAAVPSRLDMEVENLLGAPLYNQYGCTETCGPIAAKVPGTFDPPGSGMKILPGIEIRVVDAGPSSERHGDVADGDKGEIWVRSPSLMLRYDGCSSQPFTHDGWYRTGDLGHRRRGSGLDVLELSGRLKELIIRGGEKIQPEELERVLRMCPGVADVAVTGVQHDMLGEVPVAFIVPKSNSNAISDGIETDVTVLLAACRAALPDHKVPVSFYRVDAIPRTASGKLKRLALTLSSPRYSAQPLTARLTTKESIDRLVAVETASVCWRGQDVAGSVGNNSLDAHLSFTASGLTSLDSVVLRDRLASLTGLDLPVTLVFDHPTPAELSKHLQERLLKLSAYSIPQTAPATQHLTSHCAEPIAIVSMACRYPGGISSPDELWRVVKEGIDVTSDFPTDRGWNLDTLYSQDPDKPGTSTTRRGGFLHNMADFDRSLFGMSPREARATDPQQRLLLETTWELLERAGLAPSSLRGTATGVYVGIMHSDYASRFAGLSTHGYEAHLGLGSAPSIAAGRISYLFGLHGPSLAVDAACASSLVTMHMAAGSLRAGECSMAIAGGVTVMSTPRPFVMFSRQRALAPGGRCHSYSSDANGTAWSEGVGLVLLERLSDARRHGHRVLALVRGSAVNSDGASNGLTAPNGLAQQAVIRQALSQATLSPEDIDVLEGHGTATPLGDPIEAQAVLATYGCRSQESLPPLRLGSIKSNLGHTQAAAGIAGVIKMVQAMEHGIAPASLHISQPSSKVDWSSGAVSLLIEAEKWPLTKTRRPRRAAVSSFGINGTNAHIILEQEDPLRDGTSPAKSPLADKAFPWLFSGANKAALQAQARAVAALVHHLKPLDIAFSLATTRSCLAHRATVEAVSKERLVAALQALADGRQHPDVETGKAESQLAFVFSGQGSQRPEMGKELCACFPQFDATFRAVCEELNPRLATPLSQVVTLDSLPVKELLDRADYAQAAIFAFEVAMFRLLESFGISPAYVTGHSVGEIAAAHVAGYLSLSDAASLVAARGTLMASLPPGGGGMASVEATEGEVKEVIRELQVERAGQTAVIAAINGHDAVVISGTSEAITAAMDVFSKRGRPVTRLRVSHAFHSPLMVPILDDFDGVVRGLSLAPVRGSPRIPMVSTVTGDLVETETLPASHWIRHVIAPVRFADSVRIISGICQTTGHMGGAAFVEIGPSAPLARHTPRGIAISGNGETDCLLRGLGQLWSRGIRPKSAETDRGWRHVFEGSGAKIVDLPVYPFQRHRYWLDPPTIVTSTQEQRLNEQNSTITQTSTMDSNSGLGHWSLTHAAPVPETEEGTSTGQMVFYGIISQAQHPWLADHIMGGQQLLPATALLDLAVRAAQHVGCDVVEELAIVAALVIERPADGHAAPAYNIQIVVGVAALKGTDGVDLAKAKRRSVNIYSRPVSAPIDIRWTLHATGTITTSGAILPYSTSDADDAFVNKPVVTNLSGAYATLAEAGIDYGPSFQGVRTIWRAGEGHERNKDLRFQALLEPPNLEMKSEHKSYGILHPAILDAALHVPLLFAALSQKDDEEKGKKSEKTAIRLPFVLGGIRVPPRSPQSRNGPIRVRIHIRRPESGDDLLSDDGRIVGQDEGGLWGDGQLSLAVIDERTGALIAEIASVKTRPWKPPQPHGDCHLYCMNWTPIPSFHEHEMTPAGQSDNARVVRISPLGSTLNSRTMLVVHTAVAEALDAIHQWSAHHAVAGDRLVIMTQKATVDHEPDVVSSAVWGLVRSAQAEFGDRIVLLDLDGTVESRAASEEPAFLPHVLGFGENVMAVRSGAVLAARIDRLQMPALPPPSTVETLDTSGTVVITGGTGALGALISRHIVHRYKARHLLLLSRSGLEAPGAPKLLEELTKTIQSDGWNDTNVRVEVVACDIADRATLAAVLAQNTVGVDARVNRATIPGKISTAPLPPVSAVIHCAGVLDDALIGDGEGDEQRNMLTVQRISHVLRPKADGAWHLHELVPRACSFVLFSSAAGILGNGGQAAYAAANCFLDALARLRSARGLSSVSLAWGPWVSEGGMHGTGTRRSDASALVPFTDQQGLDLFDAALRGRASSTCSVVVPLSLRGTGSLRSILTLSLRRPRHRGRLDLDAGEDGGPGEMSWREKLAALLTLEDQHGALSALIQDEVAVVLGYHDRREIPAADRSFSEFGFDSFTGIQLRNRLSVLTGLRLPASLVFDQVTSSASALADYLLSRIRVEESETFNNRAVAKQIMNRGAKMDFRLATVYHRLCQAGDYTAAVQLVAIASRTLPTFGASSSHHGPMSPRRLATGTTTASPILVLLPDLFTQLGGGGSVYKALAAALDGRVDVFELQHPNTGVVPDSLATLAQLHADTVQDLLSTTHRRSVVLAGYSAGGYVAHAVACRMLHTNSDGPHRPVLGGLILIDTYAPTSNSPQWLSALPVTALMAGAVPEGIDDTALIQLGAYLRIISEAAQETVTAASCPTLFFQAQHPPPQIGNVEWRASWSWASDTIGVPGSHLELLLDPRCVRVVAEGTLAWVGDGEMG